MGTQNEKVDDLAEELLLNWHLAHGVKSGKENILIGIEHLAILVDHAFSQAERKMAETQEGEALIPQYALELLNQICDDRESRIEDITRKKILSCDVNVNLDANQVMFLFSLRKNSGGR
jgi:uncharacterized protein YbcI